MRRSSEKKVTDEISCKFHYGWCHKAKDEVHHADPEDLCYPHFQRIHISGREASDIALEDAKRVSTLLLEALEIRRDYMELSHQEFSRTTTRFLNPCIGHDHSNEEPGPKPKEHEPWTPPDTPDTNHVFKQVKGVLQVYENEEDMKSDKQCDFPYHNYEKFVTDMKRMCKIIFDGPLQTFCHQHLTILTSKYQLHVLLNEHRENEEQKHVAHRDFYNVRKVDTHIHAASCMNQKHLLTFIKKVLKENSNVIVSHDNGVPMTLKQLFESMGLTINDLSVDKLDCHSDSSTYHRFDKFNAKYNPLGKSKLREVFLKIDNSLKGKHFADIIKEVSKELEASKYQNAELRLSIYGKHRDEWDNLANWAVDQNVYSNNVRWMIQVPRLFDVFKANKEVHSFQDVLDNIFIPLLEVTSKPSSHPNLHKFLQYVIGFDSVDDESKPETGYLEFNTPVPGEWTELNPNYAYYQYYMYANMTVLNHFRVSKGLNTFVLRPHCGEAGAVEHLLYGFMLAQNISHGIRLLASPVLQYLYYLASVGIAMSPLSNNSLFLNYKENPFPKFLSCGLMVSLSTDDPLQFHYTKEPLMEEYSVAAQVWKLSCCDLAEVCRYSVLMSGFPNEFKKSWLGPNYLREGITGNNIALSNVPDVRIAFRYETLVNELTQIYNDVHSDSGKK